MRETRGNVKKLTEGLEAAAARRALEKIRLETALIRQDSVIGAPDGGRPAQRPADIEAATNQCVAVLTQVLESGRTSASELMRDYVSTVFETGLSAKEAVTIHIRALDFVGQMVGDQEAQALLESSRDVILEVLVNLMDLYRVSTEKEETEVVLQS